MSAIVEVVLELDAININASIRQVKFKDQLVIAEGSTSVFYNAVTSWGLPNRIIIKNNSNDVLTIKRISYRFEDARSRKPNFYQIKINGIDIDADRTARFKALKTLDGPYFDLLNVFKPVILSQNDTAELVLGFPKVNRAIVQS